MTIESGYQIHEKPPEERESRQPQTRQVQMVQRVGEVFATGPNISLSLLISEGADSPVSAQEFAQSEPEFTALPDAEKENWSAEALKQVMLAELEARGITNHFLAEWIASIAVDSAQSQDASVDNFASRVMNVLKAYKQAQVVNIFTLRSLYTKYAPAQEKAAPSPAPAQETRDARARDAVVAAHSNRLTEAILKLYPDLVNVTDVKTVFTFVSADSEVAALELATRLRITGEILTALAERRSTAPSQVVEQANTEVADRSDLNAVADKVAEQLRHEGQDQNAAERVALIKQVAYALRPGLFLNEASTQKIQEMVELRLNPAPTEQKKSSFLQRTAQGISNLFGM